MTIWVEHWGSTITLAATLVLLSVTAWYAALTRSLAKSAKESAASARLAAEQSAASLDVAFTIRPNYIPEIVMVPAGEELEDDQYDLAFNVVVSSIAATVYVHGVTLDYAALVAKGMTWAQMTEAGDDISSTQLVPLDDNMLPIRLHRDEEAKFALPPDKMKRATVVALQATVTYSLNGLGVGTPRRVKWLGVKGQDY